LFALLHRFRTHGPSRSIPTRAARLEQPESLPQAFERLAAPAAPLGGGTDLIPRRTQGLAAETIVSLSRIRELQRFEILHDGTLVLGGGEKLSRLEAERIPLLAQVASTIASPQIRNMATIAGNLAQAKRCWFYRNGFECYKRVGAAAPCYAILGDNRFYHAAIDGHRCQAVTPSDLATAFAALDAKVEIASRSGSRMVRMQDFYTGPGETILSPDELILAVHVPPYAEKRFVFEKLRLWEGDFAIVSVAFVASIDATGRWSDLRIACGGIAPIPWRARKTEQRLNGTVLTQAILREALDAELNAAAHPLAGNAWKLDALAGLCERAAEKMLARPPS
jgi:CO/xanthine dehydrogenase FAD-binding subunit